MPSESKPLVGYFAVLLQSQVCLEVVLTAQSRTAERVKLVSKP